VSDQGLPFFICQEYLDRVLGFCKSQTLFNHFAKKIDPKPVTNDNSKFGGERVKQATVFAPM
jgi:hypothetical protein